MVVLVTFNALADTGYGLALLVKVGLVVVLIAIGARNRLVLVPAIEASEMSGDPQPAEWAVRGLRRAVFLELLVFAALLVATATLVGRSPVVAVESGRAEEHEASDASEPVTVPLSSGAGTVTFTVDPALVGSNMVMLTLVDNDGGPLALVEPPGVELRERARGIGPIELVPQDIGSSTFHAVADIPFAGTWEVSVSARTSTFDSGVAATEVVIPG
jgi:copper transport protein